MQSILDRLKQCRRVTRIVTMGSSNTQRVLSNGNTQNWVDWMDLGLSWWYGRNHTTINSGISGETSAQILQRFAEDVELFQPHVVFITCGGNDANPKHGISNDQTKANLREMIARCRKLPGCTPILQTYYSADIEGLRADARPDNQEAAIADNFPKAMQAVRDVARETQCDLIDHLTRWEPLRRSDLAGYRALMHDRMHMNALGHTVFALDVLRHLGVKPINQWVEICAPALMVQKLLDELAKKEVD